MTLATFVLGGGNTLLGAVLAFFVLLWLAIDWCFWPRTERQNARLQARDDARRAAYRQRLIEANR